MSTVCASITYITHIDTMKETLSLSNMKQDPAMCILYPLKEQICLVILQGK